MEESHAEIEVGTAIILATGFQPFDACKIPYYGYGKYPNVYTALEVERLVNAPGPTGGEVVLRDGRSPKPSASFIAWARAMKTRTAIARGSAACIPSSWRT